MDKKVKFVSSYMPYDIESGVEEWDEGVQGGESCRVDELKDLLAWMPGFLYGWYGWANDGKGTFLDFMQVLKAKFDKTKICSFKQEDMDAVIVADDHGKKKVMIKANRIYKNLAWSLTGKTWNKAFAAKYHCKRMSLEEEMEAIRFITKHFFIIYPKDRRYKAIKDEFRFMYETKGINQFNIDPWNTVIVDNPNNDTGDVKLVNCFIEWKEFCLETNTLLNIVNHPGSTHDTKVGKGKDAPYRIVTSGMQLGGSAWNMKMDVENSIYRPERHLNPADPKVHFISLKVRQGEVLGVERGHYEHIVFDRIKKQYYFDGVCPMDGSMTKQRMERETAQTSAFGGPAQEPPKPGVSTDDLPF